MATECAQQPVLTLHDLSLKLNSKYAACPCCCIGRWLGCLWLVQLELTVQRNIMVGPSVQEVHGCEARWVVF